MEIIIFIIIIVCANCCWLNCQFVQIFYKAFDLPRVEKMKKLLTM